MADFTNALNLSTHNGMDPYNFNLKYLSTAALLAITKM
jgi:hypothetical protein